MPVQTMETPIFNASAIEEISSVAGDQGQAFVSEMAQLFLDETAKSMKELRAATNRADWKAVVRVCHSLKSSAATLGLMRLSIACKELEVEARSGASSPRTAELKAAVFDQFEQAIPILRSLL